MKIQTKCPNCGKTHQITEITANKYCQCPACGKLFHVPDLDKAIRRAQDAPSGAIIDDNGNFYA